MHIPNKRAFWIIAALALVFLAVFLVRGCRSGTAPKASVQLGSTHTSSQMSSSSTSSSMGGATFTPKRALLVYDDAKDPLLKRVALKVAEQLTNGSCFEEIQIAGKTPWIPEGERAPDVFIRLDLPSMDSKGLFTRTTTTTIDACFSTAPWFSTSHSSDSTTPPVVSFTWRGHLVLESAFRGIRTDAYADLVKTITQDFSKAISNEVQALSGKFPPMPELPACFYGPYRAIEDVPVLAIVGAERVCSYPGLFTHNETFWRFTSSSNAADQIRYLIREFEKAGWRCRDTSLTNTFSEYAQLRKEASRLEVFRVPDARGTFGEASDAKSEFVVHYNEPFSFEEVTNAIERLFATAPSAETLMAFRQNFSRPQQERYYELVQTAPGASAKTCADLASHFLSLKDTNSALRMLLRAKALSAAAEDPTAVLSSIDSIAKEISPREPLKLDLTSDLCREAGFLELTNGFTSMEVELPVGKPLLLFGVASGGFERIALTVRPGQKGNHAWSLTQMREGSRSRSSGTWTAGAPLRQNFSLDHDMMSVAAEMLRGTNRVRFVVKPGS
jgi:hypothetical protein